MYFTYQILYAIIDITNNGGKNMKTTKNKSYILWTLFKSMFVLSACTFGGGFVIVSLMKKKYVE